MEDRHLTIRMAKPDDGRALRRLAELDSSPDLKGRVLLAELDEQPVAAVSLDSGEVNANPFRRTVHTVRMLRLRRYELLRQGADLAPAPSLFRRLAAG
jgi:hypothetical protein